MWTGAGRRTAAAKLLIALAIYGATASAQPVSDDGNTDETVGQEPQAPIDNQQKVRRPAEPIPNEEGADEPGGPPNPSDDDDEARHSDTPAGEAERDRAEDAQQAPADPQQEISDRSAGEEAAQARAEEQEEGEGTRARADDADSSEGEDELAQSEDGPPQDLRDEIRGKDLTGSPHPPPPDDGDLPPPSAPPGVERPLPNYRNRPDEPLTAGDVLIWIPRGLLYPVHLVLDYGIRRPIVWTVKKSEEHHIAERVQKALSWDDGKAALFPTVYVDFGVRPNLGLAFTWKEFAPKHDIYVAASGGPNDLWAGIFNLDQRLFRDNSAALHWTGGYVRRPDNVFYSINDQPSRCGALDSGCRYRSAIGEGHARITAYEYSLSSLEFDFAIRHARFSTDADIPAVAPAETPGMTGFDSGYLLLRPQLHLAYDTRARNAEFTSGTGIRMEAFGSYNADVQGENTRWVRAGGEVGGFYDIGTGNVLGVRLYAESLQNVSSRAADGTRQQVPFHELIQLGGSERMRGFLRQRLLGENAWTATLNYRYPILWALDAEIFTSIGNVYESFSDFDFAHNYLSYGLSFRLSGDRLQTFEALIGWGSNRLSAPRFDPFDQFRLTVGINRGF